MPSDDYRYFLYSQEYVNEKNRVENTMGKEFVCGTVSVGPATKKFAYLSKTPSLGNRYPDSVIVAQGNINQMQYTMPGKQLKRGK